MSAFKIFQKMSPEKFLPRVECYMDDTGSSGILSANRMTGVLCAIENFNNENSAPKILFKSDVNRSRVLNSKWYSTYWVAHFFDHKDYNRYINF